MKKLILAVLVLSLFLLTGCISQSDFDKITDRNFELETELEDARSEIYTIEENYSIMLHTTEDYLNVLYDYFEERSVSFDEAYDAYESLSSILRPYY